MIAKLYEITIRVKFTAENEKHALDLATAYVQNYVELPYDAGLPHSSLDWDVEYYGSVDIRGEEE